MNIHLAPHEMSIVRRKASEFKEKTGKDYSWRYIGMLLKEEYEKRFLQDIDKIMKIKELEAKEEDAEKGNF